VAARLGVSPPRRIAHVAERLHLSEVSVWRRIRPGTIPAVRLSRAGRGAFRVPEHELKASLDEGPSVSREDGPSLLQDPRTTG
jgi:hypothetical protein